MAHWAAVFKDDHFNSKTAALQSVGQMTGDALDASRPEVVEQDGDIGTGAHAGIP
jgi:hypothetical protein